MNSASYYALKIYVLHFFFGSVSYGIRVFYETNLNKLKRFDNVSIGLDAE